MRCRWSEETRRTKRGSYGGVPLAKREGEFLGYVTIKNQRVARVRWDGNKSMSEYAAEYIEIIGDETPPDPDPPDEFDDAASWMLRIARYLELNGFKNLEDAIAKGFGDTSPLREDPK